MNAILTEIQAHPKLAAVLNVVEQEFESDPAHDLSHLLRVASLALTIAPELPRASIIAAALLHDIVNLPKDSPLRANASQQCADRAREILRSIDFSSDSEIESICEAIHDHSYTRGATPRSLLGKALQDADRLEAIGALGVLRCIATGVRLGASLFDPHDPWAKNRPLNDQRYSIDHFFTKLLRLEASFQTPRGRELARERTVIMQRLLEQLGRELDEPIPF